MKKTSIFETIRQHVYLGIFEDAFLCGAPSMTVVWHDYSPATQINQFSLLVGKHPWDLALSNTDHSGSIICRCVAMNQLQASQVSEQAN